MQQIAIDFTPRPLSGKKLKRITIPVSENLESIFIQIVNAMDTDKGKLGHRYIVEGIQRDLGMLFSAEPHLSTSLGEILSKKF